MSLVKSTRIEPKDLLRGFAMALGHVRDYTPFGYWYPYQTNLKPLKIIFRLLRFTILFIATII